MRICFSIYKTVMILIHTSDRLAQLVLNILKLGAGQLGVLKTTINLSSSSYFPVMLRDASEIELQGKVYKPLGKNCNRTSTGYIRCCFVVCKNENKAYLVTHLSGLQL